MSANFVTVDYDTLLLLPPDLRQWLPANHIANFLQETLAALPMERAVVNKRGSGSPQYPPRMMLGLLIYGYLTDRSGSRAIERATYDDLGMRFLSADTHPDHDTLCSFRRANESLIAETFLQVLLLAREMGFLKVGKISVDGTKLQANASKHKAMSYKRMTESIARLKAEIAALLHKAEAADNTPLADGLSIPAEIALRKTRMEKLEAAKRVIEERARERAFAERKAYEEKLAERQQRRDEGRPLRGKTPQPPNEKPQDKDQYNFTDPESRIMPTEGGKSVLQGYNAQAAVDADGSRLLLGGYLTDHANDKQELVPVVACIPKEVGPVSVAIADNGYYSEAAVLRVETNADGNATGLIVYAAVKGQKHGRTVEDLERKRDPLPPPAGAPLKETMAWRLATQSGRAIYNLRKQTIEPVFGIIKEIMGFRRFRLRGKQKAGLEWKLVMLAYNFKRLHRLLQAQQA